MVTIITIIEIIMTYFVWIDGYSWLSLIPVSTGFIVGLSLKIGIQIFGGDAENINKYPKLKALALVCDLLVISILIIMLVAN